MNRWRIALIVLAVVSVACGTYATPSPTLTQPANTPSPTHTESPIVLATGTKTPANTQTAETCGNVTNFLDVDGNLAGRIAPCPK